MLYLRYLLISAFIFAAIPFSVSAAKKTTAGKQTAAALVEVLKKKFKFEITNDSEAFEHCKSHAL